MKITVGVIFGGRSVENEISVITANQTIEAMDPSRYEVVPIYIAKNGKWYSGPELLDVANYRDMQRLLRRTDEVYLRPVYGDNRLYRRKRWFGQRSVVARLDVILPALHGTNCEDGSFQGVIEFTGIPYAGCNPLASANGMDKITMKMILKECGIPVVGYVWFSDKEWQNEKQAVVDRIERKLGYPVIVKPANSGSSVGIAAAHDREQLVEAIDGAANFTNRLIVEKLVEQLKEINCSVLGNYYECEASVCEAPVRSGEILSYADKYLGGGKTKVSQGMESTVREIPARLPQTATDFIRGPYRLHDRRGDGQDLRQRDQHDSRVVVLLSVGGIERAVPHAGRPAGGPCVRAQARCRVQDDRLRRQHLQLHARGRIERQGGRQIRR